jgi:ATP-dependent Lon protease
MEQRTRQLRRLWSIHQTLVILLGNLCMFQAERIYKHTLVGLVMGLAWTANSKFNAGTL